MENKQGRKNHTECTTDAQTSLSYSSPDLIGHWCALQAGLWAQ